MRSAHWTPGDKCLCGQVLVGSLMVGGSSPEEAWVKVSCLNIGDQIKMHTSNFIAATLNSKQAIEILLNSTRRTRRLVSK